MRQFTLSLCVVVVLLLTLIGTMGGNTRAQEATPDTAAMMAMAMHPVVGEWRNINEVGDFTVPSLAIYHADGTFIEDYPDESSYSRGVWEPTEREVGRDATLLLFTDGLVEGFDHRQPGQRLGETALYELIDELRARGLAAEALLDALLAEVQELNGGELTDDVAVVLLSWSGRG